MNLDVSESQNLDGYINVSLNKKTDKDYAEQGRSDITEGYHFINGDHLKKRESFLLLSDPEAVIIYDEKEEEEFPIGLPRNPTPIQMKKFDFKKIGDKKSSVKGEKPNPKGSNFVLINHS